jgi:uncharacterized membrane protein YfcA
MSGTMQIAMIFIGLRFLLKPVQTTKEQMAEQSKNSRIVRSVVGGAIVGFICGTVGAGGGMILVPLLTMQKELKEDEIFPASISIILPICLVSLIFSAIGEGVDYSASLPYLIGSAAGGFLAGMYGRKIPALWLHRGLGIMILWGGIRYLIR